MGVAAEVLDGGRLQGLQLLAGDWVSILDGHLKLQTSAVIVSGHR